MGMMSSPDAPAAVMQKAMVKAFDPAGQVSELSRKKKSAFTSLLGSEETASTASPSLLGA